VSYATPFLAQYGGGIDRAAQRTQVVEGAAQHAGDGLPGNMLSGCSIARRIVALSWPNGVSSRAGH
jgi:hypothetical protein